MKKSRVNGQMEEIMRDSFGIRRVLQPRGAVPVTAWRVDNAREISPDEARIKVERLHIEIDSFQQICSQCEYDESKVIQRIMDIIDKRGKLHNPFTDSGGMLYGHVEEIGSRLAESCDYKVGDEYLCLVTLTAIPMYIESIEAVDFNYGQLIVKGHAIVFEDTMSFGGHFDEDIRYILTALQEGGAFYSIFHKVKEDMRIAILGKDLLTAMLYSGVIRERLGEHCHLSMIMDHETYGCIPEEEAKQVLEEYADEVIFVDVRNPAASYNQVVGITDQMDMVINCVDKLGAETLSIFICKNKGIVYFTGLANGYIKAILVAESISKKIHAVDLDQYSADEIFFTVSILKKVRRELDLVDQLYSRYSFRQNLSSRTAGIFSQYEASQVDDFIYASHATEVMLEEIINISKYDCNVIIQGETGVGKEKVLQLIHKNSARNDKPCIKVNCATIQENLAESEFFGYEAGAFTGAQSGGKKGYFELANNGILFLDEIGTLSLSMQSKLLRVLQENQFYRVGGTKQISVNVRVVCANNIPLLKLVETGRFREDLYYRLNICKINVPPLRERKEDIYALTKEFLSRYNKKYGVLKEIDENGYAALQSYDWPGNVRELENTVHRIVVSSKENMISGLDIEALLNQNIYEDNILDAKGKFRREGKIDFDRVMEEQEKKLISYALKKEGTTRKAADALGITQAKLMRIKKKYQL